jgi:phospholipid/cholesterol/gamma-HCH transport system ATP-binding protein
MKNRAGLARAMALDPPLLFLDEPSAGLDPISSRRLDDLVLRIRDCLATTFVVVTHELPQIYAIADNTIFLDAESQSMLCQGNPKDLAADPLTDPKVRQFLFRGNPDKTGIIEDLLPDSTRQRTRREPTGHSPMRDRRIATKKAR